MKSLFKVMAFMGGVVLVTKLAQVAVDVLYDKYGKKYITSDSVD